MSHDLSVIGDDVTIKYMHTTKHEKYKTLPKNKILESNEFWNPVRPPETTLTSNGPSAFMPTPIRVILDLMESLSRYLSNAILDLLKPNLNLGPCNRLGPPRECLPPSP